MPDAQRPRETFVEDLRRRLAEQHDDPRPAAEVAVPAAYRPRGRRRFLAATALTATSVAAAVAVDRAVIGPASAAGMAEGELSVDSGRWQSVMAAADLPEGATLPFDLGAVTGFLRRTSGRVQAVSGICTHQGCRLRLDPPREQLACPCHGATFTLAGAPLTRPHGSHPLPALPRLPVRIDGEQIQVYAPMAGQEPSTSESGPAPSA
ncbi:Rieske (2Fe-2S) protein [Catenulispora yoronensis]